MDRKRIVSLVLLATGLVLIVFRWNWKEPKSIDQNPPIVKGDEMTFKILPHFGSQNTNGADTFTGYLKLNLYNGLGNVLGMLITSIAIATKNKKVLITRSDDPKLQDLSKLFAFDCSPHSRILKDVSIEHTYNLPASKFDKNVFNLTRGNWVVYGDMESFLYFKDFEKEVRYRLRFSKKYESVSKEYLTDIALKTKRSNKISPVSWFVGIHVRRGDRIETAPPPSYFKAAISDVLSKTQPKFTVHFIIASEPRVREWSITNINDLTMSTATRSVVYHYLSSEDHFVDFAVLSKCNATIMTIGTFGKWAGWLAGGDVYFKNWPFVTPDTFPSTWIGL